MRVEKGRRPLADPLVRLGMAALISGLALGPTSGRAVLIASGLLVAWTVAVRLPVRSVVPRIRRSALFLAVIVVTYGINGTGSVLAQGAGVLITSGGLGDGVGRAVRLVLAIWGGVLLASTTAPGEYVDLIERWTRKRGSPFLAAGVIALNYIPMLIHSARRMVMAQKARGMSERSGIRPRMALMARSALPLVAGALRDAENLAEAMESRCFIPTAPRQPFHGTRTSLLGWAGLALAGLVLAGGLTGMF
jgi:energy-coupling factor transport system permease protein